MFLAGEILGRNLDFPVGKISCTDPIELTSQIVFNNPKFPIVEPSSKGPILDSVNIIHLKLTTTSLS